MSGEKDKEPSLRQAVALRYDRRQAPRITASGGGETAERMLELARTHDVPIHEDAMLTASLSQIPLGEEIPATLYVAIAEVLAFVYLMQGRVPEKFNRG